MKISLFISYRRDGGEGFAQLFHDKLAEKGYQVFYDIESLGAGKFDSKILDAIEQADVFLLVLSKGALDRCVNEDDWVRHEIAHAMECQKPIIPLMFRGFEFPKNLPKDIEQLPSLNAVDIGNMSYLEAKLGKIMSQISEVTHKTIDPGDWNANKNTASPAANPGINALLRRVSIFLEDEDWKNADEYCEKVLDIDPENAQAYLGKLMSELHVAQRAALKDYAQPFDHSNNYQKAFRFGDTALQQELTACTEHIKKRNEEARLSKLYEEAQDAMAHANSEEECKAAAKKFEAVLSYKDSAALQEQCLKRAEFSRQNLIYCIARILMMNADTEQAFLDAAEKFSTVPGFRNASSLQQECLEKAEISRQNAVYNVAVVLMSSADTEKSYLDIAEMFELIPNFRDAAALRQQCLENADISRKDAVYQAAVAAMSSANTEKMYQDAAEMFDPILQFKDAAQRKAKCLEQAENCRMKIIYDQAKAAMTVAKLEQEFRNAAAKFEEIPHFQDADKLRAQCLSQADMLAQKRAQKLKRIKRTKIIAALLSGLVALAIIWITVIAPFITYTNAVKLMQESNYSKAIAAFESLDGYRDSRRNIQKCNTAILDGKYNEATALMEAGNYAEAIAMLESLAGHRNSAELITEARYQQALAWMKAGNYKDAIPAFESLNNHRDSANLATESRYQQALSQMNTGNYTEAIPALEALNGYQNSADLVTEYRYQQAVALMNAGDYIAAIPSLEALNGYQDSADLATASRYQQALLWMNSGNYAEAIPALEALSGYQDSADLVAEYRYQQVLTLINAGKYAEAIPTLKTLDNYRDSAALLVECTYQECLQLIAAGRKDLVTSVTIPRDVTVIADAAFAGCTELKTVIIPEGVTQIGNTAFYNCSSLTNIVLPESLSQIGHSAFRDCSALTEITILGNVSQIEASTFYGCSALKNITLPESTTSIGGYAFYDCKALKSITLSENTVAIGSYAFYGCQALRSFTIPSKMTKIEPATFYGCKALDNITIPDNITWIGSEAFRNCNSFTSITIPDSVTAFGDSLFANCSSLRSVTLPKGIESIPYRTFSGCDSLKSFTVPEGVTFIGYEAFSSCRMLTTVTLPAGLTDIGNSAFDNCQSLKNINIPATVTYIGESAFSSCLTLTSITLPRGITDIEKNTFYNCRELTAITIPANVKGIGVNAFCYSGIQNAYFKSSSGWMTDNTVIPSSELSSSANAATHLTTTYAHCTWTKN